MQESEESFETLQLKTSCVVLNQGPADSEGSDSYSMRSSVGEYTSEFSASPNCSVPSE